MAERARAVSGWWWNHDVTMTPWMVRIIKCMLMVTQWWYDGKDDQTSMMMTTRTLKPDEGKASRHTLRSRRQWQSEFGPVETISDWEMSQSEESESALLDQTLFQHWPFWLNLKNYQNSRKYFFCARHNCASSSDNQIIVFTPTYQVFSNIDCQLVFTIQCSYHGNGDVSRGELWLWRYNAEVYHDDDDNVRRRREALHWHPGHSLISYLCPSLLHRCASIHCHWALKNTISK